MALLFMDGFDHYTVNQRPDKKWTGSSFITISSSYARFSGQGLFITSGGYAQLCDIGVNKSTIYFGMAVKKISGGNPAVSTSYPLLMFLDESGVNQVLLCVNSAYGIVAYDGSPSLLGSSSDGVIPDQKWFYLEVKVTISATVGEVTARVNETQVLNLTSQDTKNGSDYIRQFRITAINMNLDTNFDDIYIDDAQFHGDCRIRTFMPDSISGTNNDFTASAGNKDECVDEAQSNEDTDYITSDTVNNKQTFGITTGALGTVIGIQLNNHCKLDEAGTRKITPLIRSNSTNYSGTETDQIPADYNFESEIFEDDPDDSNPWTQTKLEAAEFGLEITT
jgi:hypothetical protein